MADYLAVARRALAALPMEPNTGDPGPPKPGFEGFAAATLESFGKIAAESATKESASRRLVFPHCPRCSSFYLNRRNNTGNYECMTCGLQDIEESTARRVQ